MYITEEVVRKAIENASDVLSKLVTNYVKPQINTIKITNATSYWALISKDKLLENTYNLRVGKSFNFIENSERAQTRLEECMIHELIHTLPKCWNHGVQFQRYANRVNSVYKQYKIKTSTSDVEAGLSSIPCERKPRYVSTCKKCGKVSKWYRKPKYNINMYCCSLCGGNLTLDSVTE